jgi:transposase
LQDWLPENHLARFVAELVPGLDLSKIYGYYGRRDGRGKAAYHPVMMVRVLLYGYCVGVTSSRRIERASYDDIAFRYLCADQHPDHDSIAWFRRQHLPVLAQMFTQVLQLCDKAGLHQQLRIVHTEIRRYHRFLDAVHSASRQSVVTTLTEPAARARYWKWMSGGWNVGSYPDC